MEVTKAPEERRRGSFSEFASAGTLVFAGLMILNVAGFVFHAIASRRLGVEDYGALYALVSIYALATIPAGFLTTVIVKYAAEFRALHDDGHVRGLMRLVLVGFGLTGIAYAIVATVFAVPIALFVHIPVWTVPMVGVFCAVGTIVSALRALGQGVQDFRGYGASLAMEGIGKLGVVLLFAAVGLTIARGYLALIAGSLAGLVCMYLPLQWRYRTARTLPIQLDWRRVLATTVGASALAIISGSMGFADVVLVKHFFDANDSGLYAAASLNGKILLYVVGFVPGILVPQATDKHARGQRTRETLWSALGIIALAGFVGVIAYQFGGGLLLRLLNGGAFSAAVPLLTPYAAAMALLALTNALGSYGIATHRLAFAIPLLACAVAMFGAIAIFHPSLYAVTLELVCGTAAMCVAVGLSLVAQARRPAR